MNEMQNATRVCACGLDRSENRPADRTVRGGPAPRKAIAFGAGVLLACSLAACGDENRPTILSTSAPRQSIQPSVGSLARTRQRPEEAAMYDLAVRAPSSAGFYVDSLGRVVVQVRDGEHDELARTGVAGFIANGRFRAPRGTGTAIVITRAKYTFAQLAEWRDIVFDSVLTRMPGVSTLDLDESHNRVEIGIVPSSWSSLRSSLPLRLIRWGVDTASVTYVLRDYAKEASAPAKAASFPPVNITWSTDTIVGGLAIGIEPSPGSQARSPCTLGFVAELGGTHGVVTASHCTPQVLAADYSNMHQSASGRTIGYETVDPFGYQCGINKCRGSDASFFYTDTVTAQRGLIARTKFSAPPGGGAGSLEVDPLHPYFIITEVDAGYYYAGMNIQKVGQTTGWTSGTIQGTCVDHTWIPAPGMFGYVLTCGYTTNYTDAGGDSGGPVFTFLGASGAVGDLVGLAGVHRGAFNTGLAIFSKFSRIANDFLPVAGTLVATRPQSLSTPAVTGSISGGNPSLSWPAVPGATRYQVVRYSSDGNSGHTDYLPVTTATSLVDSYTYATQYYGTTPIYDGVYAYYKIIAISGATEVSAATTPLYFQTTLTCTGRC